MKAIIIYLVLFSIFFSTFAKVHQRGTQTSEVASYKEFMDSVYDMFQIQREEKDDNEIDAATCTSLVIDMLSHLLNLVNLIFHNVDTVTIIKNILLVLSDLEAALVTCGVI